MRQRLDLAPAAWTGVGVCVTGWIASIGHAGWALGAGMAAVAAVVVAVVGAGSRRWLWAGVLAIGVTRVVIATNTERAAAERWSRWAAFGRETPAVATLEIAGARPGEGEIWLVRGRALSCHPAWCEGAVLRWRVDGGGRPLTNERWRVAGRLVPEPIVGDPAQRYPPAGLALGQRRGRLVESRTLERTARGAPLLSAVERHLRARIVARFEPAVAALVMALVLGDRSALDSALFEGFATTGTLHLLAVSGLHVGFLAWILYVALGFSGWRRGRKALVVSTVLFGYAGLVGWRPSVVRAAVMIAAVLAARATERRTSAWQMWGLAMTALLIWRPLDLFDVGFTLSFGAVAGLLYWGRAIEIERWAPSPSHLGMGVIVRSWAASTRATTAATLGTLPFVAWTFGWFAPAAFLVNPLAIPLVAIALPLVWIAIAVDSVGFAGLASPLVATASTLIGALVALVSLASTYARVVAPGPAAQIGVAVALAAVGLWRMRRGSGVAWLAASAIVTAALPPPGDGRTLELWWLDVGQGDAIVARFPNGATWLIDAGPGYPDGDAGRSVVLPFLRRRGIDRLSWLITTHPDLDHVGGAATIVEQVNVARWGSSGAPGESDSFLRLVAGDARRTPAARVLGTGTRLREGRARIDVLHPPTRDSTGARDSNRPASANEASIVLMIGIDRCRAVLTGDIGRISESRLVEVFGDSLRAGLLHVGHHGSRHSSTAEFLAHVAPSAAVVSVGRGNRHGHPHDDTLARLTAAGATTLRTDRHGSVVARCGPAGWQLETAALYLR